jgi:hypothetical protein
MTPAIPDGFDPLMETPSQLPAAIRTSAPVPLVTLSELGSAVRICCPASWAVSGAPRTETADVELLAGSAVRGGGQFYLFATDAMTKTTAGRA